MVSVTIVSEHALSFQATPVMLALDPSVAGERERTDALARAEEVPVDKIFFRGRIGLQA